MFILTDFLQGTDDESLIDCIHTPSSFGKKTTKFYHKFCSRRGLEPCSQLGDFEVPQGNSEDESLISCDVFTNLI